MHFNQIGLEVSGLSSFYNKIRQNMDDVVTEWINNKYLQKDNLFIVGCSTSEVAGKQIGTAGSEDIAAIIFASLQNLKNETGIHLVFQCCEHLNRALVIERETLDLFGLEEVTVIPQPEAGGSMASYAYNHLENAVVTETIKVHAGIDIGDTMIGMHLKHVAVPLRFKQKMIGNARLTGTRTRPKLIGGERAVYTKI